MTTTAIAKHEWERLREMRQRFLDSETGSIPGDYWGSRRDLELYDATFARRIAWKWEAVLRELEARGRMPAADVVVDWGCGTGLASRGILARAPSVKRVQLWDRSAAACEFARARLLEERPGIEVVIERPTEETRPELLCVSHVLDELLDDDLWPLVELARRSRAVIWVEPGTQRASRRLVEVRELLRGELDLLAPCTHQAACGLRADDRNWCHHFTPPPPEVFTSSFWRRFTDEIGVDLRSVPYSFIALAERAERAPDGAVARILGRPRIQKGRALLDVCDESGVHARAFLERFDKGLFKRLDRREHEPLLSTFEVDGDRITRIAERT